MAAADVTTSLAGVSLNAPAVSEQRFCVTTAINYANGLPHMGHAYEAVSADVLARYHRAYGRQVLFMTGADEHGQKIAETAAQRGVTPIALCNEFVSKFQARPGADGAASPLDLTRCARAGAERAAERQLRRVQPDDVDEAPRMLPAHLSQVA